jgi:hypothetical protein
MQQLHAAFSDGDSRPFLFVRLDSGWSFVAVNDFFFAIAAFFTKEASTISFFLLHTRTHTIVQTPDEARNSPSNSFQLASAGTPFVEATGSIEASSPTSIDGLRGRLPTDHRRGRCGFARRWTGRCSSSGTSTATPGRDGVLAVAAAAE